MIIQFKLSEAFIDHMSTEMKDCVGKASMRVGQGSLASIMKTGAVKTLSTSILGALMEQAACNALETASLVSGQTSVGANIEVSHKRPSALGANVTAIARVTDVGPKGVFFEIEAFDETGLIGTAKHTRVFVEPKEFERRCYETAKRAHHN